MRSVSFLVVHCSASGQKTKVKDIQAYWKNVLKWKSPGYHVIVEADGTAHELQPIELPSNGVAGFNSKIINISYIGGIDKDGLPVDNRTPEQKETLLRYLKKWKAMFPKAKIQGHRDFSPDKNKNGIVDKWERIKECPCFNAIPEYKDL